jgi:hypothetical protein
MKKNDEHQEFLWLEADYFYDMLPEKKIEEKKKEERGITILDCLNGYEIASDM